MDKYIGIIGALLGTIIGFVLSLIKEYFQNKANIVLSLRNGKFNFYNRYKENGIVIENVVDFDIANSIKVDLTFNIENIGRISTGISEIIVCFKNNKRQAFFEPNLILSFEQKDITDKAFNLNPNSIVTILAHTYINKDENTSFLFDNVSLDLTVKNHLMIQIIVKTIKKDEITLNIEPISIKEFR